MGRKVTLRAKKAAKKKRRPPPRRHLRRYLYAPPSPAMRRFRVFEHDFHTVLEASVKAGGRAPAAIVRDAERSEQITDLAFEVLRSRRQTTKRAA